MSVDREYNSTHISKCPLKCMNASMYYSSNTVKSCIMKYLIMRLSTNFTSGSHVDFGSSKVDIPHLVTFHHWKPLCEWCVIRCGIKNGYKKDTCFVEIGLRLTYENRSKLNSEHNCVGGGDLYDQ